LAVTDFRIYDATVSDPYNELIAKNQGYWVVPGLLDAAVWPGETAKQPLLHKLLGPPEVARLLQSPRPDITFPSTRIDLPPADSATPLNFIANPNNPQGLLLEYNNTKIEFNPADVTITQPPENKASVARAHVGLASSVPLTLKEFGGDFALTWLSPERKISHQLFQKCNKLGNTRVCTWLTSIDASLFSSLRQSQYAWWLPESLARPLSKEHTNLYAHNRYAIAGRNPVRLVLQPGDAQGFPTTLSQPATVSASPEVSYSAQNGANQKEMKDTTIFIDLIHNKPQKSEVKVELSPELTLTTNVYFAPNCKQDWKYCLTHPVQTWWWLNTIIRDKIRATVFKEQQ
jgi:hypothetical protein